MHGRRRAMIQFIFVSAAAVTGTVFLNFWSITIGRLFLGIGGGIFAVALPRMIDETVPDNLIGTFGIITNLSINTGGMLSIVMGVGLPDPTDESAKTDYYWRIIFAMPWLF